MLGMWLQRSLQCGPSVSIQRRRPTAATVLARTWRRFASLLQPRRSPLEGGSLQLDGAIVLNNAKQTKSTLQPSRATGLLILIRFANDLRIIDRGLAGIRWMGQCGPFLQCLLRSRRGYCNQCRNDYSSKRAKPHYFLTSP